MDDISDHVSVFFPSSRQQLVAAHHNALVLCSCARSMTQQSSAGMSMQAQNGDGKLWKLSCLLPVSTSCTLPKSCAATISRPHGSDRSTCIACVQSTSRSSTCTKDSIARLCGLCSTMTACRAMGPHQHPVHHQPIMGTKRCAALSFFADHAWHACIR